MANDTLYLRRLLQRGYCCSAALAALGLRHKNSDNQELLDAMQGLCNGLGSGLLCGALSGACCMITLLMPEAATNGTLTELTEWFETKYGQKYGGISCKDILGDKPINRTMICPQIVEDTYVQARQILEEKGFIFDEEEE